VAEAVDSAPASPPVLVADYECRIFWRPKDGSFYCEEHTSENWRVALALGAKAPCTELMPLLSSSLMGKLQTENNSEAMLRAASNVVRQNPTQYQTHAVNIIQHRNCPPSLAALLLASVPLRTALIGEVASSSVINEVIVPSIRRRKLRNLAEILVIDNQVGQQNLEDLFNDNLLSLYIYLISSASAETLQTHFRTILLSKNINALCLALSGKHLWPDEKAQLLEEALLSELKATEKAVPPLVPLKLSDPAWKEMLTLYQQQHNFYDYLLSRRQLVTRNSLENALALYNGPDGEGIRAGFLYQLLQLRTAGEASQH